MKKNILSLSGILVAGLLFGGCAATQSIDEFAYKYSPENVGKTLRDSMSGKNQDGFTKTFEDKELAKAFVAYYDKPKCSLEYDNNNFLIKQIVVGFDDNLYLGKSPTYIRSNIASNEIFTKYKEVIKAKGNTVKMYAGTFNKKLLEVMTGRTIATYDPEYKRIMDLTSVPVIAEFNSQNELVSILLVKVDVLAAFNQINNPNVQSEITLNAYFFVGAELNPIKYQVSENQWKENQL